MARNGVVLNANPSDLNANCYLTYQEADTILLGKRLGTETASKWATLNNSTPADVDTKETALIWASTLLDHSFSFKGRPTVWNQPMRWPRVGILNQDAIYVDWLTVPPQVKEAVATLAFELLKKDRMAILEPAMLGQGFSNARVGPLSITIDRKQILGLIPQDVIILMLPWGTVYGPASGGGGAVKLVRG